MANGFAFPHVAPMEEILAMPMSIRRTSCIIYCTSWQLDSSRRHKVNGAKTGTIGWIDNFPGGFGKSEFYTFGGSLLQSVSPSVDLLISYRSRVTHEKSWWLRCVLHWQPAASSCEPASIGSMTFFELTDVCWTHIFTTTANLCLKSQSISDVFS